MYFELQNVEHAVVFGGGRGIGYALVEALITDYPDVKIHTTYRNKERSSKLFDLKQNYKERLFISKIKDISEMEIKNFVNSIGEHTANVELLINVIGVLHDNKVFPEKKLSEVNLDSLDYYFRVNSFVTVILAKYFHSLFRHSRPSCFSALSAKVGSIEDNRLGGWYGYRASKAALNMFLKNIAIEYNRRGCACMVSAVHPGTTLTGLSDPFNMKHNYKLHSPLEAARNILEALNHNKVSEKAYFKSWDKKDIAW